MQEILDALGKMNEAMAGLSAAQEAQTEVTATIQASLEAQQRINEEVFKALRHLLGIDKERPKLRLFTNDPDGGVN